MKHANVMNLKTGKGRGLGTASDDLGSALNPANALWNVALGLATPLLNRDALDADVKIATDCKLIFLLDHYIRWNRYTQWWQFVIILLVSIELPPLTFILLYIYGKKASYGTVLEY